LFIIQSAIPNQGDAWTWIMDNLRRALEDAALEKAAGAQSPHTFTLLNEFVAVVGRRVGEMHVALAPHTNHPAFAPRVADDGVVPRRAPRGGARPRAPGARRFRSLAQSRSHGEPAGSRRARPGRPLDPHPRRL